MKKIRLNFFIQNGNFIGKDLILFIHVLYYVFVCILNCVLVHQLYFLLLHQSKVVWKKQNNKNLKNKSRH